MLIVLTEVKYEETLIELHIGLWKYWGCLYAANSITPKD
jgi:hypothetical protein